MDNAKKAEPTADENTILTLLARPLDEDVRSNSPSGRQQGQRCPEGS